MTAPGASGSPPRASALRRDQVLERLRDALGAEARDSTPDFGVALVESWASVLGVLGFYQDRIAAENYVTTAAELFSLRELARSVGVVPIPGTAATGILMFTVTAAPGLDMPVTVPAGTGVQSVPVKGGVAQVFETSGDLHADAAFDAILPRDESVEITPSIQQNVRSLVVSQFAKIAPGDLIIVGSPESAAKLAAFAPTRRVLETVTLPGQYATRLNLAPLGSKDSTGSTEMIADPVIERLVPIGPLFGQGSPSWASASAALRAQFGIPNAGLYVLDASSTPAFWVASIDGLPAVTITCILGAAGSVYVGTAGAGIFSTRRPISAASTWMSVSQGLTSTSIHALCESATGELYAGTVLGGVFRSVDGGKIWDPVRGLGAALSPSGGIVASTRLPPTTVRCLLAVSATDATEDSTEVSPTVTASTTHQPAAGGHSLVGRLWEAVRSAVGAVATEAENVGPVGREARSAGVSVGTGDGVIPAAVLPNPKAENATVAEPRPSAELSSIKAGDAGIDISHFQLPSGVPWAAMSNTYRFVIIQTTSGRTTIDAYHGAHRAAARRHGLATGSYHFAYPRTSEGDAAVQAEHFVSTLDKLDAIVPGLDFEQPSFGSFGLRAANWTAWILAFCGRVTELTGETPMLYTNLDTLAQLRSAGPIPASLTNYPLWIADYGRTIGVHLPWTSFAFWQSSKAHRIGPDGPFDFDVAGPDIRRALIQPARATTRFSDI